MFFGWEIFLIVILAWDFFGLGIGLCFRCDGFQFVNPKWIYENYNVNRFGAIFLSILFGLICPIGTAIYWLYKLCTFGRDKNDG
jgi:hypothetical protein